jgi:hypothetical protein
VAVVVIACFMAASVRDALTAAEERLHVQAWQLRQMVPREAHLSVEAEGSDAASLKDAAKNDCVSRRGRSLG